MSLPSLPKTNIQGVIHYSGPGKGNYLTGKATICGISTNVPARKAAKNHALTCNTCFEIVKHVHLHQRRTKYA